VWDLDLHLIVFIAVPVSLPFHFASSSLLRPRLESTICLEGPRRYSSPYSCSLTISVSSPNAATVSSCPPSRRRQRIPSRVQGREHEGQEVTGAQYQCLQCADSKWRVRKASKEENKNEANLRIRKTTRQEFLKKQGKKHRSGWNCQGGPEE
jgi:hypothetical protein